MTFGFDIFTTVFFLSPLFFFIPLLFCRFLVDSDLDWFLGVVEGLGFCISLSLQMFMSQLY